MELVSYSVKLKNKYSVTLVLYNENSTPQVQYNWQHQVYTSILQVPAIWQCPTPLILVLSILGIHHPMLVVSLLDACHAHTCQTSNYILYTAWKKVMNYENENDVKGSDCGLF
jgi:hypothetical protein